MSLVIKPAVKSCRALISTSGGALTIFRATGMSFSLIGLSASLRLPKTHSELETRNLVCMPTLSVGETDRGNHSVAIQRRSESQSGECEGQSGVSSRRDCFAIVAEGRLTLSGVASGVESSGEARKRVHRRDFSAWRTPSPIPTCQMGSGALVVGKIIFQSPAQRSFIPHDDVV
jgi:hypothetical protein